MQMKNQMLVALIEEYRKVALEYNTVLKTVSQPDFVKIINNETQDSDCISIQTITSHVVQSGYTYSNYINDLNNIDRFINLSIIDTPENSIIEIDRMIDFAQKSFAPFWNKTDEQIEKYSITSSWKTVYDIEQLLEHAIVHILRHRRQIEKFLVK